MKKKDMAQALKWRKPEGVKFDISGTDVVDDDTFCILDHLCPSRRVLLQYSTGKDSCAAWLELRRRGYTVVPVFKEIFPGLSFFDKVIAAHEEFFGVDIHVVPHKVLYFNRLKFFNDPIDLAGMGVNLKDSVFQACESKSYVTRYNQRQTDMLLQEHGCDIAIVGAKSSDSLHRRTHFTVDGPYLPRERLFSLLWRVKKSAPYQIMLDAGLPIPSYYFWLGRSPELFQEHEMFFIREHFPEDFEKLKAQFKNLDAYVKAYEEAPKLRHAVRAPKILLEAKEKGALFV